MKIIGFTGTHSTGKTTLLNELEKIFPNSFSVKNIARNLKAKGFKISDKSNIKEQMIIIEEYMKYYNDLINLKKKYDYIFFERTLIDAYAYTLFNEEKCPLELIKLIRALTLYTIKDFDHIFYLPIEFDLVDDNIRVKDERYRRNIDKVIRNFLLKYNINHDILTGSVEQRLNKILQKIK